MRLTERSLRQLVRSVLIEGIEDDYSSLTADNPGIGLERVNAEFKDPSVNRKLKTWLTKNLPALAESERFGAVSSLFDYAKKVKSIVALYTDPTKADIKAQIDRDLPGKRWSNPGDIVNLTLVDIVTLLKVQEDNASEKQQRVTVDRSSGAWAGDKIGETANWNIWFPTTRDNSINIYEKNGGREAREEATRRNHTVSKETWCTATTDMQNLFNMHVADGHMLYYITRKQPVGDPEDLVSIDLELDPQGEVVLAKSGMKDGGTIVDAGQKGLKTPDLRRILGADFERLLDIASRDFTSREGTHPIQTEILDAAQDITLWEKFTEGNSVQTRYELYTMARSKMDAKNKGVNRGEKIKFAPEIPDELCRDCMRYVASYVKERKFKLNVVEETLHHAHRVAQQEGLMTTSPGARSLKSYVIKVIDEISGRIFVGNLTQPGVLQRKYEKKFVLDGEYDPSDRYVETTFARYYAEEIKLFVISFKRLMNNALWWSESIEPVLRAIESQRAPEFKLRARLARIAAESESSNVSESRKLIKRLLRTV